MEPDERRYMHREDIERAMRLDDTDARYTLDSIHPTATVEVPYEERDYTPSQTTPLNPLERIIISSSKSLKVIGAAGLTIAGASSTANAAGGAVGGIVGSGVFRGPGASLKEMLYIFSTPLEGLAIGAAIGFTVGYFVSRNNPNLNEKHNLIFDCTAIGGIIGFMAPVTYGFISIFT